MHVIVCLNPHGLKSVMVVLWRPSGQIARDLGWYGYEGYFWKVGTFFLLLESSRLLWERAY